MAFFPTGIYPNPRPPYHPQPGNPDNSGSKYVHSFWNSFEPAHWNSGKVMGAERSLCRPLGPQSCPSLWDPMDCSTPVFPAFIISQSLLIFMSIESLMPSNHLILCRPLLLLPSVFPSIGVFSNESALHIIGQNIGASASVLPMNIQDWLPLGLSGLIFQFRGL